MRVSSWGPQHNIPVDGQRARRENQHHAMKRCSGNNDNIAMDDSSGAACWMAAQTWTKQLQPFLGC